MVFNKRLTKILLLLVLSLCIWSSLLAEESVLKYRLIIDQPRQHIASVSIQLAVKEDTLTLAMPAWSPGRYIIYNFAQNVFDLQVKDETNKHIRPILIDKQTWKIPVAGSRQITIRYRVFANTLDGTFSSIDSSGATINGSSIFAYIAERMNSPVELGIDAPDHWQVVCALDPLAKREFKAACYDHLVDSPLEMGKLFTYRFKIQDKDHFLVFRQAIRPELLKSFKRDLKKIIAYFAGLFDGNLPYDHYTFFFHLNENLKHTDGMEHANACRVILRMNADQVKPDANSDANYDNLIWLSAHEFFHVWNVKRLRPAGLGPFDYSKEVYTPNLWIAEGWTSYYAYLSLLRSGIYTQEKFLNELSGRITRYENSPGKAYRTMAETSILSWLFNRRMPRYAETNINQTTYSFYYKGLITGFLLDILLRSQTQSPSSLDDLIRQMWLTFYKNKKSDYFLSGRGYTQQEVERMIINMTGESGQKFLKTAVHSTRPLPYELVQKMGLRLKKEGQRYFLIKEKNSNPQARGLWESFAKRVLPD
ncbi:M61 family metallopeptidase [Calditrichota bacterium LG25]